jgi:hypothetical protein
MSSKTLPTSYGKDGEPSLALKPHGKCPTNIDRRKCSRIVPMRVLALGLSRTGTECWASDFPKLYTYG